MAFQYIDAPTAAQPSIYPESAQQPPQQQGGGMQGLGLAKQFMGGSAAAPTGVAAGGGPAGMADVSGLAAAEAGMGAGGGMGAFGGAGGSTAFAPAMSAPGAAGGGGAGGGSGVAAAGPWAALFAAIVVNEYNAMKTGDRPEDKGELLKEYGTAGVLKSDVEGRFSKYFGGKDSGGTALASAMASPAYADPRQQWDAQKKLVGKAGKGLRGVAKSLGKVF